MKPRYGDLTAEEKEAFGNGCGLYCRWLRVPQFIFTASCMHHDFNYSRGGGFGDKTKADFDFFKRMFHDAQYSSHPVIYTAISVLYFIGVTIFGVFSFNWSKEYKTKEEILRLDEDIKRLKESKESNR